MKTATKKRSKLPMQKSPIKGMTLGEYRLMVMKKSKPLFPELAKLGDDIWNLKK